MYILSLGGAGSTEEVGELVEPKKKKRKEVPSCKRRWRSYLSPESLSLSVDLPYKRLLGGLHFITTAVRNSREDREESSSGLSAPTPAGAGDFVAELAYIAKYHYRY